MVNAAAGLGPHGLDNMYRSIILCFFLSFLYFFLLFFSLSLSSPSLPPFLPFCLSLIFLYVSFSETESLVYQAGLKLVK